MNNSRKFLGQLLQLLEPKPPLTLSQWADTYRQTSRGASAEVGPWVTRPYQREPMDAFTDPRIRVIVILSAVQMLKTELILNALGYVIERDPGPVLVIQFRDSDADIFSKKRLAPMIRDTPILRGLVAESKSRKSDNTITDKSFPGGYIRIAASASPGNLSALPIRYLFMDEVDKYPASAGAEGDPITVAEGRLAEWPYASKEILTCSPTLHGISRIEKAYEDSDKREFFVPCPHCGEYQILRWAQVKWDDSQFTNKKRANTAVYVCERCSGEWNDGVRWQAIARGEYRATAPFNGVAGFRINSLCSVKRELSSLVLKWLKVQGDTEQLKVFINTELAETWQDKGEAPEWEILLSRRESYDVGTVPRGGLFLTAGVDVQRDRLECEVVAWGRNRESWSIEYQIFEGKTSESAVWEKLAAYRSQTFMTAAGVGIPITRMFVDSGDGTMTNDVYSWVRTQPSSQVIAIKGTDKGILPVGQPSAVEVTVGGRKIKGGVRIRLVNVSFFKAELYANLRSRPPTEEEMAQGYTYPPGYCHFPSGKNYGDEHFKQICAEQLITRANRRTGRTKREWQQTRARNEALDCRIYARAAAWDKGLDRMQERHWRELEKQLHLEPPKQIKTPEQPSPSIAGIRQPGLSLNEIRPKGYWGDRTKGWFER
ncbi:MAG: phage terminase large subunit family protein [Anaerolineales bacterium]|nr:phage terminase large subunit family protein [Anaerolineales bacterium]